MKLVTAKTCGEYEGFELADLLPKLAQGMLEPDPNV
jgi:hypothetical protein